jgi:hypothetical protein
LSWKAELSNTPIQTILKDLWHDLYPDRILKKELTVDVILREILGEDYKKVFEKRGNFKGLPEDMKLDWGSLDEVVVGAREFNRIIDNLEPNFNKKSTKLPGMLQSFPEYEGVARSLRRETFRRLKPEEKQFEQRELDEEEIEIIRQAISSQYQSGEKKKPKPATVIAADLSRRRSRGFKKDTDLKYVGGKATYPVPVKLVREAIRRIKALDELKKSGRDYNEKEKANMKAFWEKYSKAKHNDFENLLHYLYRNRGRVIYAMEALRKIIREYTRDIKEKISSYRPIKGKKESKEDYTDRVSRGRKDIRDRSQKVIIALNNILDVIDKDFKEYEKNRRKYFKEAEKLKEEIPKGKPVQSSDTVGQDRSRKQGFFTNDNVIREENAELFEEIHKALSQLGAKDETMKQKFKIFAEVLDKKPTVKASILVQAQRHINDEDDIRNYTFHDNKTQIVKPMYSESDRGYAKFISAFNKLSDKMQQLEPEKYITELLVFAKNKLGVDTSPPITREQAKGAAERVRGRLSSRLENRLNRRLSGKLEKVRQIKNKMKKLTKEPFVAVFLLEEDSSLVKEYSEWKQKFKDRLEQVMDEEIKRSPQKRREVTRRSFAAIEGRDASFKERESKKKNRKAAAAGLEDADYSKDPIIAQLQSEYADKFASKFDKSLKDAQETYIERLERVDDNIKELLQLIDMAFGENKDTITKTMAERIRRKMKSVDDELKINEGFIMGALELAQEEQDLDKGNLEELFSRLVQGNYNIPEEVGSSNSINLAVQELRKQRKLLSNLGYDLSFIEGAIKDANVEEDE